MFQKKTWKSLFKSTLLISLVTLLVISMTACSFDSFSSFDSWFGFGGLKAKKTKTLFENITAETGLHIKYAMEVDGKNLNQEVFKKGDKFYVESLDENGKTNVLIVGDTLYTIDESTKEAFKINLEGEQKEQIQQSMDNIDKIYNVGTSKVKGKKGHVKIDGMEYDMEEFSSENGKVQFVYNDDGVLTYLITITGEEKYQMKIGAMDGNVPDSRFEVPEDYKITDLSQPNEGKEEETRTVTSYEGGFSFQAKKSAIVEINREFVDVFLENQSTIPYYHIYPMMQVNHQTVDQFLDGVIEAVKKNQSDKLLGEPEKTEIAINGKQIKGFTYSYSENGGKDVVISENYADLIDGTFYNWASAYMKDDNVTPADFRAAMESFQLK